MSGGEHSVHSANPAHLIQDPGQLPLPTSYTGALKRFGLDETVVRKSNENKKWVFKDSLRVVFDKNEKVDYTDILDEIARIGGKKVIDNVKILGKYI